MSKPDLKLSLNAYPSTRHQFDIECSMKEAPAPVVAYLGMTHLGVMSALGAAEKGYHVICWDPDAERVSALANGMSMLHEPGFATLYDTYRSRLCFTVSPSDLESCPLAYIASDVPTDPYGNSDLTTVYSLVGIADAYLPQDAVMVILSQVPPGFTRRLTRDKSLLFYQVETLIFGRALERVLRPERHMIGAAMPTAPLPSSLLQYLRCFDCPLLLMGYESAELAKIAINLFLASSITTTNAIAALCEHIGADWAEIVPALQADQRIGPHAYLTPGLGVSGGNLERDMTTFCTLADIAGTPTAVVQAWMQSSRWHRDWVLRKLHAMVLASNPHPVLGILGLTYKADTASVKNSPSVALIHHLRNCSLRIHDPVVGALPDPLPCAICVDTVEEVCVGADALIVMTPWSQFRTLTPEALVDKMRGNVVIDPFAVLDGQGCRSVGLNYCTLGVGCET